MSLLTRFLPFLSWMKLVNAQTLKADLIAGFTGAVIVLPQGVAFATIAGLPPEYGLYTAMVTPIIAALFGSSLHLISGPTTAISIVIFSTVSHHAAPGTPEFIEIALTMTFLAGVYQFVFGLVRMGALVNFISHTVVIGFTAGAAILIVTSQLKHVLGVPIPRGESFAHTWIDLWHSLPIANFYAIGIGVMSLLIALAIRLRWRTAPNLLIALLAGGGLTYWLGAEQHAIALVGEIPGRLPPLSMPDFSYSTVTKLASEAFAVAMLGLIEAVSISRSIASKSNQRVSASQEFIGQGLSNVVGSFFSSYAGSGSFTRSGVNYAANAKTPFSAIFAAIILMLIVLLIAPLTAYLPVPAMAGVILLVAYNLIDMSQIKHILSSSRNETIILIVTFLATLFLELEFAIYLGVLVSLVIFLWRTSTPEIITLAPDIDLDSQKNTLVDVASKPMNECPQLRIIRIDMSIYFGSLNHVQSRLIDITEHEKINHILIIGTGINFVDLSGEEMLLSEARRLEKLGGGLYFADLKPNVYEFLGRAHFISDLGNSHFFDGKKQAIRHIQRKLDQDVCSKCSARVFHECKTTV
ncbi:MAG: SulP family inorganic anion transporter [Arenicellales bacterium]